MRDGRLRRLNPHHGTSGDACWHATVSIDPGGVLKTRARQKAYLARYGRQSLLQWEDREVAELVSSYVAVSELVGEENSLIKRGEDR